jgi:hypothetical protein
MGEVLMVFPELVVAANGARSMSLRSSTTPCIATLLETETVPWMVTVS